MAIKRKKTQKQNHHRNSSRWAPQNRGRETMRCGGGEPRRVLKYMHAYHMSPIAASSSSRSALLDSLYLTNPWLKVVRPRLRDMNTSAWVDFIVVERGRIRRQCERDDLQFGCCRCALSWLTHIAKNPCWSQSRKECGERTALSILCPSNLFAPLNSRTCGHKALRRQISQWMDKAMKNTWCCNSLRK